MTAFFELPPTEWIASNDVAIAVRDAAPVAAGHCLIFTRRAVVSWWHALPEERRGLLELIDVVKLRLDVEFAPAGYTVGFDSGVVGGQDIAHLHLHVIPRYEPGPSGSGIGLRTIATAVGAHRRTIEGSDQLVTPFEGHLRTKLLSALSDERFDRIDLIISFVMFSGVHIIASQLDEALGRRARVRLLTTDYLRISDPAALSFFLDRSSDYPDQFQLRVFSDERTSFHPKGYLFRSSTSTDGLAVVGSSNLSRSGLVGGVEWNIETRVTDQLLDEFERMWSDARSITVERTWLDRYRVDRAAQRTLDGAPSPGPSADAAADLHDVQENDEIRVEPWSVQREALAALSATRIEGQAAGLVVMATGLGKTWLAAFDSTRPSFRRVLFIAHRDEILTQARDVFRQIRPDGNMTMFTGAGRDPLGDVVFASVQSLARNLSGFPPDAFDYIVVDEFHHASAPTYRRVISHFRPGFLLGLTATPDRADAADLLALCADNLVYECDLIRGIDRELLSTFHYRAIRDVADYEHIPWRSGRFDPAELSTRLETRLRAAQVFDEWSILGGQARRTLGFCSSISHAEFMAEYFRNLGVRAVAVHSGAVSAPRAASLSRLEDGDLSIIFTIDIFSEGVDVPNIDLVLMLRPTESPIVFFQQLGRGLRRAHGKTHLDVLDMVGNHRSFLLKGRILAQLCGHGRLTDREALDVISHPTGMPTGCSIVVDTEAIELLKSLLAAPQAIDRLGEFVRDWTDEHGRRPTALEASVAMKGSLNRLSEDGWFGILQRFGVLNRDEIAVRPVADRLFRGIEQGAFTKSYKLVTLRCMLQHHQFRDGMPVADLARAALREIQNDARLSMDLDNTSSEFANPGQPTETEWLRYWRRNPLAAWTRTDSSGTESAARDASAVLFDVRDDVFSPSLEVPADVGETFDQMVGELVEYRLHRYVTALMAKVVGERRTMIADDGSPIDSTFEVQGRNGRATSVVQQSAGGAQRGGDGVRRNSDYVAGLDLLLERFGAFNLTVVDAYVDTQRTEHIPVADRRVAHGDFSYPLDLSDPTTAAPFRRAMLNSMAKVGRAPNSTGGNSRRALRFVLGNAEEFLVADLADALASGRAPVPPQIVMNGDMIA